MFRDKIINILTYEHTRYDFIATVRIFYTSLDQLCFFSGEGVHALLQVDIGKLEARIFSALFLHFHTLSKGIVNIEFLLFNLVASSILCLLRFFD